MELVRMPRITDVLGAAISFVVTARIHLARTGISAARLQLLPSRAAESTARVVLWRELGLMNSFILEASFAEPTWAA
jgi:hypothetical protein